jgi:uncharacterized protein YndB with AHSA1/START domain
VNAVTSLPRALVDVLDGQIVASIEISASPERVFRALASPEIVNWWVNPGVFDTREWSGDVRVGGRWRASGVARGALYVLEGEFLEVRPPRKLVHTWHLVGTPNAPSTVTYELDPINGGTRLNLRHSDITSPEAGKGITAGWDFSLRQLAQWLAAPGGDKT